MTFAATGFSGFSFPWSISSERSCEWWMTSYFPPNCGYSFFSVLKQCGHAVTIFFTPRAFSVSTFAFAIVWNRYSFPMRRAGSPVHFSSAAKIANFTPAFCMRRANAVTTFRFRSSNEPAHPTQNRYSTSRPSSAIVGIPRPSAHFPRWSHPMPHGL